MQDSPITVYWRPGCGFCARLLSDLDAAGARYEKVNIWEDPDGAAVVRKANNGNELVPTVSVSGQMLSNPSAQEVLSITAG